MKVRKRKMETTNEEKSQTTKTQKPNNQLAGLANQLANSYNQL